MNILLNFEFVDYNELDEYHVLEAIKNICEFEEVVQPYLIDITSKSYYKKTIKYKIKIYDLSQAT